MGFDAIIFDLDGTLWDSSETVAACWREVMSRHGELPVVPDGSLIRSLMGMTSQQICDRVFAAYGEKGEEICKLCLDEEPVYITEHGARLFEGLEQVLDTLAQRLPLFIVSNCQKNYIESFLNCSGMGRYFKGHTCEGDTGLGKADNISLIMKQYGITKAIYVGDTASDEKSALAAGCEFVHAAYGFGTAANPIALAENLRQIPDIIFALMEDES